MNLEQAKNNLNYYYSNSKKAQAQWNNNYKVKVDNIAKMLNLSFSQKELVILLVKADLVSEARIKDMGLTKDNIKYIASLRGNTKDFKILQTIAESKIVISSQCKSFKDRFFNMLNNYNNR